jgi:hypothetical protein
LFGSAALLIVKDRLRRGFAQLKLGAHLLNLRSLLFQTCSEGFDFPLLLTLPRSIRVALSIALHTHHV